MSYIRVIPRDFYNESKLLKCMGLLALKILDFQLPDGIKISIEDSGEPFDIQLDEMWNMLRVINYPVTVNGETYDFGTAYNAKYGYPFYVLVDDLEIEVFNEAGDFTQDFIEQFTKK